MCVAQRILQTPCLNTWVIMMIGPYLLALLSHTLELYKKEAFSYLKSN